MKHELGFRFVKIADIGYITILYAISGLVITKAFDLTTAKLDTQENKQKSSLRLFFEIVLYLWIAGILIYAIRNIMEIIPSPFQGMYGLQHLQVKELGNAGVFVFIFFYFGESLKEKLNIMYDRLLI